MKQPLRITLLIAAGLAAAPAGRTFTGIITDSMCATADHSRMRMGPTDPDCVLACIQAHGALFVLFDGKEVYTLSNQEAPEKFAGQKVTITGDLDARTKKLRVDSIVAVR